jgi:hypothetical protein
MTLLNKDIIKCTSVRKATTEIYSGTALAACDARHLLAGLMAIIPTLAFDWIRGIP